MKHTALRPKRLPLVAAIAAIGMMGSIPAHAFEFDVTDEVRGSLDTTLTYGALWRVSGQDSENIGLSNGGSKASVNYDNGNQNYERGDLVSSLFKMTNDLSFDYKNFGAFFRVLSFYDHAIQNKDFDPNRSDQRVIRNRLGHDYEIFDAYVRGSFDIANRNLNVKLGQQVLSWGESTFIPNSINSINPVDVSKLRAPGRELKEAFLPVKMLSVSLDVTDNVSVEAFNQFEFKKTRIEPNGSYFSSNDFASPGGSLVTAGAGTVNEDTAAALVGIRDLTLSRTADRDAKDSGQYGVAIRVLAPELNNTEFGIYAMNYHSRTPIVSGSFVNDGGNTLASTYFNEYPEDISLYGLSFNTLGPFGIALQGEYSYRPNQPLQTSATDGLIELITGGAAVTSLNINGPTTAPNVFNGFVRREFHQFQMTATQTFGPQLGASQLIGVAEAGYTYIDTPNDFVLNGTGYDLAGVVNPSNVVATPANPQTTPPTFTAPGRTRAFTGDFLGTSLQGKGGVTRNSYGYRAVMVANYNNAFQSINLSPRVAFSHDLRGTSPTFNQGVKAVSVGVGATYLNAWTADVAYTNFFGGETYTGLTGGAGDATNGVTANPSRPVRTNNNPLSGRDFIAASVSYAF